MGCTRCVCQGVSLGAHPGWVCAGCPVLRGAPGLVFAHRGTRVGRTQTAVYTVNVCWGFTYGCGTYVSCLSCKCTSALRVCARAGTYPLGAYVVVVYISPRYEYICTYRSTHSWLYMCLRLLLYLHVNMQA